MKTQAKNTKTILAVDPGSREMGVAVISGEELEFYGVKSITNKKTANDRLKEASLIIHDLISTFQPQVIAINRRIVIHPNGELLVAMTKSIKRSAELNRLTIYEHAPEAIKRYICGKGKSNNKALIEKLVAHYPELKPYSEKHHKWEEVYYGRMFAAVAVALVCLLELTGKEHTANS